MQGRLAAAAGKHHGTDGATQRRNTEPGDSFDTDTGAMILTQSTSNLSAVQFVQQVLATRPAIAVFDCDGTLWSGDAGADFFYWEMERGFVAPGVGQSVKHCYNEYLG